MWEYYVVEFFVIMVITIFTGIFRYRAIEKLQVSADMKNAIENVCTATVLSAYLLVIGHLAVQIAFGKI